MPVEDDPSYGWHREYVHDELVEAAMLAYQNKPITGPHEAGLKWLRTPLERVVDAIEPKIRASERERLADAWREENHDVRFNKHGYDLTPAQRVEKWIRDRKDD